MLASNGISALALADAPENVPAAALATALATRGAAAGARVGASTGASSRNAPLVVDAMRLIDAVPAVHAFLREWSSLADLLHAAAHLAGERLGLSRAPRVRLTHLPGADFARTSVSQLRVSDRGRFVRFLGTLTRAGAVKVVQEWRDFRCEACGHQFRLRASAEAGYEFEVPGQCASGAKKTAWDPKIKRPRTTKCSSRAFQPLPLGEDCMADFQEVRVQDRMEALTVGVIPQSVAVVFFGDLVGKVQPGDSLLVEGVVWPRMRNPWVGKRIEVELFVEATHVERLGGSSPTQGSNLGALTAAKERFVDFWQRRRGDEWCARAELIGATAPWLSGMPVPKLALLLALIGGTPGCNATGVPGSNGRSGDSSSKWGRFQRAAGSGRTDSAAEGGAPLPSEAVPADGGASVAAADSDGAVEHVRTTPHLLLLGDPGTGKSQLLQVAQELSGRSVRTSGQGCTNAGLTCAAVRDGPDWVLEAGALVLADGGVCCIDEFSMIRSHDRAAVHEAMEQQTVSVSKAGLVCRLRSECTVIAAQNCKGSTRGSRGASYDRGASIAVNSGLPPPLLSRFDLVVVFASEGKGVATEQEKADVIINSSCQAPGRPAATEASAASSHEELREYIAWAKGNMLEEAPSPEAQAVLEKYFMKLRQGAADEGGGAGANGITIRTFQSLWRLAQAHARLMHHRGVELGDAVAVIVLHRAALQDHVVGADGPGGDGDFEAGVPDREGETAWCSVRAGSFGAELHHATDITSASHYAFWEAETLRYVGLQPARPYPIMDAPSPLRAPAPSQGAGRSPLSQGGSGGNHVIGGSQAGSQGGSPGSSGADGTDGTSAAGTQVRPRGRKLGFRMR